LNKPDNISVAEQTWFLYIVVCSDDSLYTGITTNIDRRLYEHNYTKKGAKYTRSRRPVQLRYCATYPSRSIASKAEASIKKLKRADKLILCKSLKHTV
jgi:putative endonuclease